MTSADFWTAFWPSVASGVVSAVLLTILATFVIGSYRKLNLRVAIDFLHTGSGKKVISLTLINSGRLAVMPGELQWLLLFERYFQPEGDHELIILNDQAYVAIEGENKTALLPGGSACVARIVVGLDDKFAPKWKWLSDAPIFCAVLTTHGYWNPRRPFQLRTPESVALTRRRADIRAYRVEDISQ